MSVFAYNKNLGYENSIGEFQEPYITVAQYLLINFTFLSCQCQASPKEGRGQVCVLARGDEHLTPKIQLYKNIW